MAKTNIVEPTCLTPTFAPGSPSSLPDLQNLELSTKGHIDTSKPDLIRDDSGGYIHQYYDFAIFPLFEAQSILTNLKPEDFLGGSDFNIKPLTIRPCKPSMSVEDQDRVSEDGHLHVAAPPNEEANELIKAVDEMLESLTTRFTKISTEVFSKMDEMSQRLDELEASIKAGADNGNAEGGT